MKIAHGDGYVVASKKCGRGNIIWINLIALEYTRPFWRMRIRTSLVRSFAKELYRITEKVTWRDIWDRYLLPYEDNDDYITFNQTGRYLENILKEFMKDAVTSWKNYKDFRLIMNEEVV